MISLVSTEAEQWCIHLGWLHSGLPHFWRIPLTNSGFTLQPSGFCFCVSTSLRCSVQIKKHRLCLRCTFVISCPWILFKAHKPLWNTPTWMPAHMQEHTQSYYHHFLWWETSRAIFRSSAALENLTVAQNRQRDKATLQDQDVSDCGFSGFSVFFVTSKLNSDRIGYFIIMWILIPLHFENIM